MRTLELRTDANFANKFRFGIELETCMSFDFDMHEDAQFIKSVFMRTHDDSIDCNWQSFATEFVSRRPFQFQDLESENIKRAFNGIAKMSHPCSDDTCGTHVHMSHQDVTLRTHPKFMAALQVVWLRRQREMNDKFYRGRVFNRYCHNNFDVCMDAKDAGKYFKLNIKPTFDKKYGATIDSPIHVEFRGWGAILRKGEPFPFDKLKEYLQYLMVIWNEAMRLDPTHLPSMTHNL